MRRKDNDLIIGWHPVQEALDSGKELTRVLVLRRGRDSGRDSGRDGDENRSSELLKQLHALKIPVQKVPREKLDRVTGRNHQGIIAFASPIEYVPLEEMVAGTYERGESPVLVALDGVTDVGNLGAIARSAECFGATGLIVQTSGGAPVNADAVRSSSGALLRIPVARVPDLKRALKFLGESGLNLVALTEKSEKDLADCQLSAPCCIVAGSEHTGISHEVWNVCHVHARIPMTGQTGSLNVGVATGIALYTRQLKS